MGIGKRVETFLPERFTMICRSYGANRNLATNNYKDVAPTEHDLDLPNVRTPVQALGAWLSSSPRDVFRD